MAILLIFHMIDHLLNGMGTAVHARASRHQHSWPKVRYIQRRFGPLAAARGQSPVMHFRGQESPSTGLTGNHVRKGWRYPALSACGRRADRTALYGTDLRPKNADAAEREHEQRVHHAVQEMVDLWKINRMAIAPAGAMAG